MISMIFQNILIRFIYQILKILKYFPYELKLWNSMGTILKLITNILALFLNLLIHNELLWLNQNNTMIISCCFHFLTSHRLLMTYDIQLPMMFLLFINNGSSINWHIIIRICLNSTFFIQNLNCFLLLS